MCIYLQWHAVESCSPTKTKVTLEPLRSNGIPDGVVSNGDSTMQRGKVRDTGTDSPEAAA